MVRESKGVWAGRQFNKDNIYTKSHVITVGCFWGRVGVEGMGAVESLLRAQRYAGEKNSRQKWQDREREERTFV